jgi:hypothetical protein
VVLICRVKVAPPTVHFRRLGIGGTTRRRDGLSAGLFLKSSKKLSMIYVPSLARVFNLDV